MKLNTIGKCPCKIPNTMCNQTLQKCVCKEGYMESSDEQRCIKQSVHLDNPCEIDEQCSKDNQNSMCISRSCACKPGFKKHEDTCFSIILTSSKNETCLSDDECHTQTPHSKCITNHCVCDENFLFSKSSNVNVSNLIFNTNETKN